MRRAATFILGFALGAIVTAPLVRPYDGPRLVGFDCLGAAGPIYADEESDFPPCLQIAAYGSASHER